MQQPTESVDALGKTGFSLLQAKDGYRFSLDPVLLCGFADFAEEQLVVDLGAGNGVIPLLVASRSRVKRVVGVECQPDMVERAGRSVRLNSLQDRIEICQADIRQLGEHFQAQSADMVLSNPPYRAAVSGRIAPGDERAAARHELAGGLEDFLKAAAWLLKNGGRFYMVHLPERLTELLDLMRRVRIEPKRLRCVHSRPGEDARLLLVEGRRAARPGGLKMEPPLYIYEGDRYSAEVLSCYEGGPEGSSSA